ncbi:unnamed protein product, partial [Rotaria sordida]
MFTKVLHYIDNNLTCSSNIITTPSKQRAIRLPQWRCWHPLLSTFSVQLIIAFRTLLEIAVIAITNTLGATIQTGIRLFVAGAISATYCLLIVNICPRYVYYGVGASNVLVLLIAHTDLPITVRHFSIVPTYNDDGIEIPENSYPEDDICHYSISLKDLKNDHLLKIRENPRHSTISNTDVIRLNKFLLLIVRLVHATIIAAKISQIPGTHLDIDSGPTTN